MFDFNSFMLGWFSFGLGLILIKWLAEALIRSARRDFTRAEKKAGPK